MTKWHFLDVPTGDSCIAATSGAGLFVGALDAKSIFT